MNEFLLNYYTLKSNDLRISNYEYIDFYYTVKKSKFFPVIKCKNGQLHNKNSQLLFNKLFFFSNSILIRFNN